MRYVQNPDISQWHKLIERPSLNNENMITSVEEILQSVKSKGDSALIHFTEKFDGIKLDKPDVNISDIPQIEELLDQELMNAIMLAYSNIKLFHSSQFATNEKIETMPGISCWRKQVPIDRVGLYIPGGSAPLFSTLLMLAIPAKLAGCREIVVCTPPQKDGSIAPSVLYTAKLLGIDRIFKVGGAQAIAAMTYGTASIPRVDKIFGPGNQYVTIAKTLAQREGIAIDIPAGPSEVLIIADETSVPAFVAADLLSQAEHGPDSQVILLSNSDNIIAATNKELEQQISSLPRREIADLALKNSMSIKFQSVSKCIDFSNHYAPEHLIIASNNAMQYAEQIVNAGSVFIGNYSCESAGDYASGTNHTLPTNGYARNYSGVSLDSFFKSITFQYLSEDGLKNIGPAIERMATEEGLEAHRNAVSIRLNQIRDVRA